MALAQDSVNSKGCSRSSYLAEVMHIEENLELTQDVVTLGRLDLWQEIPELAHKPIVFQPQTPNNIEPVQEVEL